MVIFILLLSYLLGSIPFALIIGKGFYKTDIRNYGSGNLGGTNTFRVLGKKAGMLVSIGDIAKGTVAASLPLWFQVDLHPVLAGIPAIIGHCYPVFAKFKGGKAVATSGGVFLFVEPIACLIGLIVFLTTLKISKYVSLSSMVAAFSVLIYCSIFSDWLVLLAAIALTCFIIYRHRANIKRIKDNTEPKVSWL